MGANAFSRVTETITAKVTTSGGQAAGTPVKIDAANTDATVLAVTAAVADEDLVIGILLEEVASDARDLFRAIQIAGVASVKVNGSGTAIVEGNRIVAGASGLSLAANSWYSEAQRAYGVALAPAGGNGDFIPVLLRNYDNLSAVPAKAISTGGAAVGTLVKVDPTESTGGVLAVAAHAADTELFFGVALETIAEDATGFFQTDGIALVKVNGQSVNIAAGDLLEATTGGVGKKADAASTTLKQTFGVALQPATTDGALIPVQLHRMTHLVAA